MSGLLTPLSRAQALRAIAAATSVAVSAGLARPTSSPAQVAGDTPHLTNALELEQAAALAYDIARRAPGLDARSRPLIELIASHERMHVNAIGEDFKQVALTGPPRPPRSVAQLSGPAAALARARGTRQILSAAAELEAAAIAAYLGWQGLLADARTLESTATILASEAQHLTLLRVALGSDPLPRPLEVGRV